MDDDLKGTTAIAWRLTKPPYTSGGGRSMNARHCHIMILGTYLVTGFGAEGSHMRYRVFSFDTAKAALRRAVRETQKKENEGFVLSSEPHTAVATGGTRTKMDALVGLNEPNGDMHASTLHVLNKGDLVADMVA